MRVERVQIDPEENLVVEVVPLLIVLRVELERTLAKLDGQVV